MTEKFEEQGPSPWANDISTATNRLQEHEPEVSGRTTKLLGLTRLLLDRKAVFCSGVVAAALAAGAYYSSSETPKQSAPAPEVTRVITATSTLSPSLAPAAPTVPTSEASAALTPSSTPSSSPSELEKALASPSASPSLGESPSASASPVPQEYPCNPVAGGNLTVCQEYAAGEPDMFAYTYPDRSRQHAFALTNGMQIMPECRTPDGAWLLGDYEAGNVAGYIPINVVKGDALGAVAICN